MSFDIVIGWIIILILAFYLVRNFIANFYLYPAANFVAKGIKQEFKGYLKGAKIFPQFESLGFRNYYLFVLNPFLWRIVDVFEDAETRKWMREAQKNSRKIK